MFALLPACSGGYTAPPAAEMASMSAAAPAPATVAPTAQGAPLCIDGTAYSKRTFYDGFTSFSMYSSGNPSGTWTPYFSFGRTDANNHDLEFYVDPDYTGTGSTPLGLNPFKVTSRGLEIAANRAPPSIQPQIQNFKYTSGMITTQHSHLQQYGYFEMTANLPAGQGLWPAFWMLAPPPDGWPPEIDMMEMLGNDPNTIYQSLRDPDDTVHQAVYKAINSSSGLHTYSVKWTATQVVFLTDGTVTGRFANSVNEPMYMLANLAVGGNWPGPPDSSTVFPAVMTIRSIRAFADTSSKC
jgi:beta-glucanase (GH16 family)